MSAPKQILLSWQLSGGLSCQFKRSQEQALLLAQGQALMLLSQAAILRTMSSGPVTASDLRKPAHFTTTRCCQTQHKLAAADGVCFAFASINSTCTRTGAKAPGNTGGGRPAHGPTWTRAHNSAQHPYGPLKGAASVCPWCIAGNHATGEALRQELSVHDFKALPLMHGPCLLSLPQAGTGTLPGGGVVRVSKLNELQLQGCLMVDPSTLAALQIMQEERHASQMGIGKPREGFSIFGIMQRCATLAVRYELLTL